MRQQQYSDGYQAEMALRLRAQLGTVPHGDWAVEDPEDEAFPELRLVKGGNDE